MIQLILIWVASMGFWYWFKRRHLIKHGSVIPGPKAYPIIGNALDLIGSPERIFKKMAKFVNEYPRIFALWIGPKLNVFLYNPQDIEIVLKSKDIIKADMYDFYKPWLGEGLFTSRGEKFKRGKKIVWPVFQVHNVKRFIDTFNRHSENFVKVLQCEIGKGEFDSEPYINSFTLEVLLETILGLSKEVLGEKCADYVESTNELAKIAHMRTYKYWMHFDFLFNLSSVKKRQDEHIRNVHDLTEKVIRERKEIYEKGLEGEWKVFLDALLAAKDTNGNPLTDEDIKSHMLTVIFGGQDTTASTMGFLLSLLGLYPDAQEKIVEELHEIFGDSDRYVTYEDLPHLTYMEQVIKETWRLYPPAVVVGKETTGDIELENYTIPKGCTVAVGLMQLHRDPEQFPNPHVFDPDNFSPEKVKTRHPYSYLPFSSGFRTCVGGKYAIFFLKTVLATLLRSYRIVSTTKQKDYVLAAKTVLKRKDGYLISLEPRVY